MKRGDGRGKEGWEGGRGDGGGGGGRGERGMGGGMDGRGMGWGWGDGMGKGGVERERGRGRVRGMVGGLMVLQQFDCKFAETVALVIHMCTQKLLKSKL